MLMLPMLVKNLIFVVVAGVCVSGGLLHFFPSKPVADVRSTAAEKPVVAVRAPARVAGVPVGVVPPPAPDTFEGILAADPEDHDARAARMLMQLCQTGRFAAAIALIGQAPAELQAGFYRLVFQRWAQSQPLDAVQALDAIADPEQHSAALKALADGWNVNDPARLAAYASSLPTGADREYALGQALGNWSLQDPAAMATWLNTVPPGNDFDLGASLMIARTDGANRPPELAMQWVENIDNPELKLTSFQRVVSEWAQTDPAAAQKYVNQAAWLDDTVRTKVLESLAAAP